MHVACIGHLRKHNPVCVRVAGTQPCIAPDGRVAPRVSQALWPCRLHKGMTGCGFCVLPCLQEQVPEWKPSPGGGPGRCGYIKGFPTARAPGAAECLPWHRRPCHRACATLCAGPESFSLAQLWESSLGIRCWVPQVCLCCLRVWTRVRSRPVQLRACPQPAERGPPALPCQCSAPAGLLSLPFPLPVSRGCKALRIKPTRVLSEMSFQ